MNAESTRIIEDGTLNDQPPLTVENSILNVDYTDALSEASGQQPPGTSFGSTPLAVPYLYGPYSITWSPPRCVTTTGTPKD